MLYTIDMTKLTELVTEEVSRIAAGAFSENGVPLYDAVVIHSRDADTVSRAIRDALDAVLRRTADVCTYIPSPAALSFFVPDMDESKEGAVTDELDRAVSLGAVAVWMQEKFPVRAQEYADRSAAALDRAVAYLKTRKFPKMI